jgi:hypothetical protein
MRDTCASLSCAPACASGNIQGVSMQGDAFARSTRGMLCVCIVSVRLRAHRPSPYSHLQKIAPATRQVGRDNKLRQQRLLQVCAPEGLVAGV